MVNRLIAAVLLCLCLMLTSCKAEENTQHEQSTQLVEPNKEQIKAIWLSCYELSPMFAQGTKESFISEISEFFETCSINGINTAFVHMRAFCDAFYPSSLFDWSIYALSSEGEKPDFDPFEIIIDFAKDFGVSVHAWINPYRVSYDKEFQIPEKISSFSFSCDQGVFLDPSNIESRRLVLDGVREIMENYDVDGIHIDDYFYPLTKDEFDKNNYELYKSQGGRLSQNSWRRENVNSLVSAMYSLVHSIDSQAVFSISPVADVGKNKHKYYADVELWVEQKGYADWIIPQLYFGFEHDTMPFEKTALKWLDLAEKSCVKLIGGLALYKTGTADKAAGSGIDEWIDNDDVIKRQIDYLQQSGYDGYALFSYSGLKSNY